MIKNMFCLVLADTCIRNEITIFGRRQKVVRARYNFPYLFVSDKYRWELDVHVHRGGGAMYRTYMKYSDIEHVCDSVGGVQLNKYGGKAPYGYSMLSLEVNVDDVYKLEGLCKLLKEKYSELRNKYEQETMDYNLKVEEELRLCEEARKTLRLHYCEE